MKVLRVLVLLLFCVLLPLRGAVGAAMPCAQSGQANGFGVTLGHADHGMHGHHRMDGGAAQAPQGHADAGLDGGAKGDGCHLCASGCHAVAMVPAVPSVLGALPLASAVFPAVRAPAPDFESEGQERPPRTV